MREQGPTAADPYDGLKDFQRATATYAFQRMFVDDPPTKRFLIADEVGLGKTLVARGLIAKAIQHLHSKGQRRIDVVYICSNAAIARQNLRRLVKGEPELDSDTDRLTMLPIRLDSLAQEGINLMPITPGTSLRLGRNLGRFGERALLFTLLSVVWGRERLAGAGPARLFYTGISDDDPKRARRRLYGKRDDYAPRIPRPFLNAFKRELIARNHARRQQGRPILQRVLDELAEAYRYRRSWTKRTKDARSEFIGELRQIVAELSIQHLQPDLVILDEFQRFKSLLDIDGTSWETRLAHRLFDAKADVGDERTRVLLLSATPYRMFTQIDDPDQDDHHEDLIHTARFLFDDDAPTNLLSDTLQQLHLGLTDPSVSGITRAKEACSSLTEQLRQVMARTERLSSDLYRDGMLVEHSDAQLPLAVDDVRSFLTASRVAEELGVSIPVDYWKSGPYLVNFLEGYAFRNALDEHLEANGDSAALREAVAAEFGLLPWESIEDYQSLDPGNARLRSLIGDTVDQGLWKLLWLPPAAPYYATDSEFDSGAARQATKRLVFSAWRLVPKVIAAITSYAAERNIVSSDGAPSVSYSTDYHDRSGRLLDFRLDGDRPAAMTSFAFVYPSPELAQIGAVNHLSRDGRDIPHLREVRAGVRTQLQAALRPHLQRASTQGMPDPRWIWAAPLLLDAEADENNVEWLLRRDVDQAWMHTDSETGFRRHLDMARDWLDGPRELGRPPDDLIDSLVDIALFSPANCALRALWKTVPGADEAPGEYRKAAARVAWGFRSLFNGPIETALVRSAEKSLPYWRAVLDYSAGGNLQSVLDEYFHVLREWTGKVGETGPDAAHVVANAAYEALAIRTTRYFADIPVAESERIRVERHAMRGRFAVQFGAHRESHEDVIRAEQAAAAFNSPFWPFVLATTSIGQEGLDFHLYCHAVVHWNLPHNPVDLEQREGRVHRYKGHAVRKNLAESYFDRLADYEGDVWQEMFELGVKGRRPDESDLVPYWVFRPDPDGAAIERHVPMLPLSRERSRFPGLMRAVTAYRLAFGQPRQEELLGFLLEHHDEDEIQHLLKDLRVDLSPPTLPHLTETDPRVLTPPSKQPSRQ